MTPSRRVRGSKGAGSAWVGRGLAGALWLLGTASQSMAQGTPMALILNPPVAVAGGLIAGTQEGDSLVYRGIPYAAPPVDPLRWRPTQPVQPLKGARPATQFGANCLQPANLRDNGIGPGPASEDCLTLNIWAPAARGDGKRPVMVWVYGGSFTGGSASAALYDGQALARRGVVVVTLNHRLGRFGFFAHSALTADAAGGPVANYGLMDMVAAMRAQLKGAPHASDRQYVFGTLGASPWATDAQDHAVAGVMGDLWAAFARSAQPALADRWPPFSPGSRVLDIGSALPEVRTLRDVAPPMLSVAGAYRPEPAK